MTTLKPTHRNNKLTIDEKTRIVEALIKQRPDDLGVSDIPLWTKKSISTYISRNCDQTLSTVTIYQYLVKWGLACRQTWKSGKPKREASARSWLEDEYPKIKERARENGAKIFWLSKTSCSRLPEPIERHLANQNGDRSFQGTAISASAYQHPTLMAFYDSPSFEACCVDFLERLMASVDTKAIVIFDDAATLPDAVEQWARDTEHPIELFSMYKSGTEVAALDLSVCATMPRDIREVEAMERELQRACISPERYWYLTTQMKIALAGDSEEVHTTIEKCFSELRQTFAMRA
jgi:transposase